VRDRQTAAVREAATKRTADTEARVRKTLRAIATSGTEVNFVAVATAARVSRQFLYSHPELRAEIEQLRTQTLTAARLPDRASAGDESARHRLRAALDDNQRLRDENRLLKEELAIAHGELRELRHSRARATVTQT
jgi:Family of unknown function (DUF6262)